jgi:hypothetical protein
MTGASSSDACSRAAMSAVNLTRVEASDADPFEARQGAIPQR